MERIIISLSLFLSLNTLILAQQSAGIYMSKLGEGYKQIQKDTWDYVKQVSRGRNASKIEKRRIQLANTLRQSKQRAARNGAFEGDNTLKTAVVDYLHYSYLVINEDYRRIVNLEKIAEESYDDMETYLMTKEAVNKKMDSIANVLNEAEESFAKKYNITLLKEESRLSKKLNNANEVNAYYNKVFLVFFKCNWYENRMLSAFKGGKISDVEQYRQSLEQSASEGIDDLRSIGLYRGDRRLKDAGHFAMEFFSSEATTHIPRHVDFLLKQQRMETVKKNFDAKNKNTLTQQDVDAFNKTVSEFNDAVATYNKSSQMLNRKRNEQFIAFEKAISGYFDRHM